MSTIKFDAMHYDVLKELSSIGTAHAATALSGILNKKVTVTGLNVSQVPFKDVSDVVGGPENLISGILMSLSGTIDGMMLYMMDMDSTATIASALLGRETSEESFFEEMEQSALCEFGNMMICSYINSLAELTHCKIIPSVPFLAIDMANAVLSVPVAYFGTVADSVLMIESRLLVDNIAFAGWFLLVPNLQSFHDFIKMLGVG